MELAAAELAAGARPQDSAAVGHAGTPGLGPASLGATSAGTTTVRAECAMAYSVGDAPARAGGSGARETLFTPSERMLGAPPAAAPAGWGEDAAAAIPGVGSAAAGHLSADVGAFSAQ
eukprot:COSAG04_NODE_4075_length_2320_cov_3.027015_3_plen_117_part_01